MSRFNAAESGSQRWTRTAIAIASLSALPLIGVATIALQGSDGVWGHLIANVLPVSLANTLMLMIGTGVVTFAVGTSAAWLVTMHRFPGRAVVDVLLVLPMAIPAYIVAYAYVELLSFSGPVQSAWRSIVGASASPQHAFDVRSMGGAIFVLSSVLYPYVYLAARASFEQQSVCVLEVARTLGRSASEAFWAVALPLARPAIIAGVTLVLMETLNDLGAVQYLGVETLSASIYATWLQRSSLPGAAQISLLLLALVIGLLLAERALRGNGSTQATTGRYRAIPFETLTGWRGTLALGAALMPPLLGFAIPGGLLAAQAIAHYPSANIAAFAAAGVNSITLAVLVSIVASALAFTLAYAVRLGKNQMTKAAMLTASLGYALPGTVLAIGAISVFGGLDSWLDQAMRARFGISTGLILSGTLFAVTFALVVRFLTVAIGSIDAGLQRISPNLDAAARTLGATSTASLLQIHLPMIRPALGAATLLVFVDTMKELPATLLLRPFNFETLPTYIYGLTATEQFEEAALGATAIVLIGLIPVLYLHRRIADGRSNAT